MLTLPPAGVTGKGSSAVPLETSLSYPIIHETKRCRRWPETAHHTSPRADTCAHPLSRPEDRHFLGAEVSSYESHWLANWRHPTGSWKPPPQKDFFCAPWRLGPLATAMTQRALHPRQLQTAVQQPRPQNFLPRAQAGPVGIQQK
jgi:hypothetical protein